MLEPDRGRFGDVEVERDEVDVVVAVVDAVEEVAEPLDEMAAATDVAAGCFIFVNFNPAGKLAKPGKAKGVVGIDFLLNKLGEFFPDLVNGGVERLPLLAPRLPLPPALPALPPDALLEFKDGDADLEDPDLLDNDEEIDDGIFNGFSFTVGVFLKLLLCKSLDLWPPPIAAPPPAAPFEGKAGEVLAEEGADRDPAPEEVFLLDDTLGEAERPPEGA